jgi:hypothetical protein
MSKDIAPTPGSKRQLKLSRRDRGSFQIVLPFVNCGTSTGDAILASTLEFLSEPLRGDIATSRFTEAGNIVLYFGEPQKAVAAMQLLAQCADGAGLALLPAWGGSMDDARWKTVCELQGLPTTMPRPQFPLQKINGPLEQARQRAIADALRRESLVLSSTARSQVSGSAADMSDERHEEDVDMLFPVLGQAPDVALDDVASWSDEPVPEREPAQAAAVQAELDRLTAAEGPAVDWNEPPSVEAATTWRPSRPVRPLYARVAQGMRQPAFAHRTQADAHQQMSEWFARARKVLELALAPRCGPSTGPSTSFGSSTTMDPTQVWRGLMCALSEWTTQFPSQLVHKLRIGISLTRQFVQGVRTNDITQPVPFEATSSLSWEAPVAPPQDPRQRIWLEPLGAADCNVWYRRARWERRVSMDSAVVGKPWNESEQTRQARAENERRLEAAHKEPASAYVVEAPRTQQFVTYFTFLVENMMDMLQFVAGFHLAPAVYALNMLEGRSDFLLGRLHREMRPAKPAIQPHMLVRPDLFDNVETVEARQRRLAQVRWHEECERRQRYEKKPP